MTSLNIKQIPLPDQDTIWVSKEYGIRARSEFQRHLGRATLDSVADVGSCQLRGLGYALSAGRKRLYSSLHKVTSPKFDDQTPIGKADAQGLAILFHGLNGQPSLWDEHVELFNQTQIEVYVPEVPEEGHLSLTDKSSYALLDRVVDWTSRNPGKPIALFGQSNGTRFALIFEIWLRERAPKTPVHVSLTAGVLYGTSTVDITNTLLKTNESTSLSLGKLSKVNCEELAFGSDTARKLVGDARQPLSPDVAERDYAMYSPMHDVHVPDTGSGLPILVPEGQKLKKERHYIVSNYGHNAIVTALAQRQVEDCTKWMKERLANV